MLHRKLWIAGALALGSCGGLAADGKSPAGAALADCAGEGCSEELGAGAERGSGSAGVDGAAGRRGFVEPDGEGGGADGAGSRAGETRPLGSTGEPCRTGAEGGERTTIGEIVLEASGNCDSGHLCISWASGVDDACPATASAGCGVVDRDDELVPVPPALAPARPAVDRVCTCRCDGGESRANADYCVCPEGMQCRELIASSGVNGAAGEFVGSYCLY